MFNSPLKKVLLIFFVSFLAAYVSLPKSIPVNLTLGSAEINKPFIRKDLNLTIGKFSIHKEFNLVLGLDLAGGSHLVFEAQTQDLSEEDRKKAIDSVRNIIERRVNLFGVSEPNVQTSSFEGSDRVIVELPGIYETSDAVGLIGKTAQLEFAEVGEQEEPTLTKTDLTGADLKSADVTFDRTTGKPVVAIEFSQDGAQKFAALTARNVGKPLPIVLDGDVISAPVVQETISGGSARISGEFDLETAQNLAIQLNAGALPTTIKLIEQRTVGATLGAESVSKSVRAGVVGLLMVLVFMVLSYGKFGLIADIALIIFGVLTLALYKMIPVVLTLPGIAGFLLSVGMAVDSNILIFERFKEEIKQRPFRDALEVSFGRAWDSIRDANISTLVTAFVLANPLDLAFLHTSGPVRGFALTLSLGILISLFTGIVVSRNLLRAFVISSKKKHGLA